MNEEQEFQEKYESKLIIANELELIEFIFVFKNVHYICRWSKNKWTEPKKIRII